jgi:hypothetical protein
MKSAFLIMVQVVGFGLSVQPLRGFALASERIFCFASSPTLRACGSTITAQPALRIAFPLENQPRYKPICGLTARRYARG